VEVRADLEALEGAASPAVEAAPERVWQVAALAVEAASEAAARLAHLEAPPVPVAIRANG
jgi:hypothetical protein